MAKEFKRAQSFYDTYSRKAGRQDVTHYCPGCGHGVLHKLIAEAIDDFQIQDRTILISPVGCSVFAYYYFETGNIQCAHGRAPAVATGIKRVHPHSIVLSYQGDGDLAAIGGNNILHAANRGESITVFFVNNAIYGMTGGQMAPTTLIGQKTTTTPYGRGIENEGYPVRVCELLSSLQAPVYIERVALTDAKHTNQARRAVRNALETQMEGKGFSLVEVLSTCPSGWKMSPVKAKDYIHEHMTSIFPLGVFKDRRKELQPREPKQHVFQTQSLKESLEIPVKDDSTLNHPAPENRFKNPRLIIAGFGGQGVLMFGVGLAQAGMQAGYHVSWIPSYGPEMRGGTANCNVNLSDRKIGSPLVSRPTVLIAFNLPSLDKFESKVEKGGLIFYNQSMIDRQVQRNDVESIAIPATEMAEKIGDARVANMFVLGAYAQRTAVLDQQTLIDSLPHFIKRKNLIPLNQKAIKEGAKWMQQYI